MDLRELLGDKYVEGMTFEELEAALAGKELVDPATLPKTVRKEQFDVLASELAAAKKQLKEIENQNLSEEQRIAQEMTARDELISSLRKEVMRVSAREKLAGADIEDKEFIDSLLEGFEITDDTKFGGFVDKLVETVNKAKLATEKAVTAKLMAEMPTPPTAPPEGTRKLADLTYTEQMKLKAESPAEYNRLLALETNI